MITMFIEDLLTLPLSKTCDLIFAIIPQKTPSKEDLKNCKIISHRGQHDNIKVFENTLTAFDNALNNKGISLEKLGKYEEAIEIQNKAIEIDPKCIQA